MSYERPDPDRGPYTPPTDDHLPFDRSGFDARGAHARRPVPLTLVASAIVLLVLIAAVVLFYRSGVRGANQAPPAIGEPVGELAGAAPDEAQPIDPEAGIDVYVADPDAEGAPEFTPPPELPQQRPAPLVPAPTPPAKAEPTEPQSTLPATPLKPDPEPAPAPAPAGGSAAVQIGAFSSEAIAMREYAAVAGSFPQFASGASRRVEEVQTSGGQTVYRTTFQGLSAERARAFCAALRAAGRDCLVR